MERKLPALTAESRAFWQGGAQGQLLIHFCDDCDRYFHPPATLCAACLGLNVAPRPVTGAGTIMSFTINHQQWRKDLPVPYVVAIVELAEQEGLRLVSNILTDEFDDIYIGMPVQVTFLHQEDVWIPLFEIVQ